MFDFFCSLYFALFTGQWVDPANRTFTDESGDLIHDVFQWLGNALGGHFSTIQEMPNILDGLNLDPLPELFAIILSCITLVSVCAGVFALVKGVFKIFFNRG